MAHSTKSNAVEPGLAPGDMNEIKEAQARAAFSDSKHQDQPAHLENASVYDGQPGDNGDDDEYLDEIYDIVDAVVPRTDDPTMPVITFRVVILGGFFCLALCCANTLFTFRTNSFYTNPFIGVLLSYPLGKLMERYLPKGMLNPGPFNYKEHALIYICCYALYNIIGQKYQLYQESLGFTASLLFAINTQIFGYGLAGLCRRYLMLWPSNLSIVALLFSLHDKPGPDEVYRTSRYKFFWIVAGITMLWQFVPGYFAPIFTAISVLCYVAPSTSNPQLTRMLGSANQGFGLLSLSFDWNVIGTLSPITTPLWALLNQVIGLWIMVWILTPILWVNNAFGIDQKLGADPRDGANGTGTFPLGQAMNTPFLFDRNGTRIQVRNLVTLPDLVLDKDFYDSKKPIYITTYFAMEYFSSFMVFVAAIVHVSLWYGRDIWVRFRTAIKDLDAGDIHARLMDVYPEVPDWWYITTLVINIGIAIGVCQWGGFDLPWWGVLLGLALAVVSILPLGIIQAISGQGIGLNVMSEFLIGLILPGRLSAVMSFKTLSYMSMYQGLLLVSDLKLGHYVKIPPRSMFLVQLFTSIVSSILNVFIAKTIYESFGKTCQINALTGKEECLWKLQSEPPFGWSATGYNVFLNAGAIWGAIGPAKFFGPGSPYEWTLIGFALGLILPFIPWTMHRIFPNGYWHLVNVPLLVVFPGLGAGSTRSEMITPLVVGITVNYFVKKYRHAWWKKYAYVLSAALDSGLAIALTILFLGFQAGIGATNDNEANKIFPYWGLHRYDGEICAPDFFLRCKENENQGKSWGGKYFMVESIDPYCTSINFQNKSGKAIVEAIAAGVLNATGL
ncbi:OPT oligopeptide transporter protein-domain-containing protein [Chytridium lagenaria]|nr:OPT oligopeptide transporter protein-domain-containing protein [Chytridium lagenaria]